MAKILVCDDDKEIVEAIEIYLTQDGHQVLEAYDGIEAVEILKKESVDLLIMDIMMPRMDGIRATLKIREKHNIPIIILSAKSEDADKILGLNIGADDYITKPFNPLELVARVKSHLRRYMQLGSTAIKESEAIYTVGGLAINDDLKEVTVDGEPVKLTSYVGDTLTDSAELEGNDAEDLKAPIVCKLSDGSYHYYSQDDFNEKVLNGELKFLMPDGIGAETSEQILDELENVDISDRNEMTEEEKNFRGIEDAEGTMLYVDCWKYDGVLFREEAAPLEAENLLQIVNENSNWNGRLNEAYNMLESCIYQIGERYGNYESLTEQYKEGDSNYFYYCY